MSSGDEALNKIIKGFFEFLGAVFRGVFFLSKEAVNKNKVSTVSVSARQQSLESIYRQKKQEFENSKAALYDTYQFAENVVLSAVERAEEETGLNYNQLPRPIVEAILDTTVSAIKEEKLFSFSEIYLFKTVATI